ncbi:MAG: NAD(P)H-hydrate dehydratase [Lachnospiraceae bacterium]
MKYLVDSDQMRECDRNTSEYYKVPSVVLMERAALAVLEHITPDACRILIVCGTGNNGADGLAVARLLKQQGRKVSVYLAGEDSHRSELNRLQLEICQKYGVSFTDNISDAEYDMVVDALFGIGYKREPNEQVLRLMRTVNAMSCPVIAVDMPSGVDADTGRIFTDAVRADLTVTFGFPKMGMYRYPGKQYCGQIMEAPIGITKDSFLGNMPHMVLTEETDVKHWWQKRTPDGNKGTFGKVLLMAGSRNMAGACILAARSCYRAGAGMVRIVTCEENRELLLQSVPEALLTVLPKQPEELAQDVAWADVVVAGPGIGTQTQTAELLCELIRLTADKPLVLDADALNLLAVNDTMQDLLMKRTAYTTVLTPHPGELSRLTGKTVTQLKQDSPKDALDYAKKMHCILVAKDAVSTVLTPQGQGYLCDSGNDGMATAGTGDVLTGIIGAMLAGYTVQSRKTESESMPVVETVETDPMTPDTLPDTEPDAARVVAAAVYLHGMAGEMAAEALTKEGVMAGDLIEYLPEAICRIRQENKKSESFEYTKRQA